MRDIPGYAARWLAGAARWCAMGLLLALSACGGGGLDLAAVQAPDPQAEAPETPASGGSASGTPGAGPSTPGTTALAPNEVRITLDRGTDGGAVNSPFVDVTVCAPDGGSCKTIDHVLLDTGSFGLRIAASALGSQLSALPAVQAPDGRALAECAGFVSGYAWGSVRKAQVRMASETAREVPVHVMNDPSAAYAKVPDDCSSTGVDLADALGAKGILGVGFQEQDCGRDCVNGTFPGLYFSCAAAACAPTTAPLASQVANPVALFATHNNGLAIRLPAVAAGGAERLEGTLVLGVGTAANNQLRAEQVFAADARGQLPTTYAGRVRSGFLDTGSNGIFFRDRSIATCSGGFYCPASALSLSASVAGADGLATRAIDFRVENAASLPASTVAAHLGGDFGSAGYFDWGLPFFFGRTVFVAFRDASTPAGTGPFWAF